MEHPTIHMKELFYIWTNGLSGCAKVWSGPWPSREDAEQIISDHIRPLYPWREFWVEKTIYKKVWDENGWDGNGPGYIIITHNESFRAAA